MVVGNVDCFGGRWVVVVVMIGKVIEVCGRWWWAVIIGGGASGSRWWR